MHLGLLRRLWLGCGLAIAGLACNAILGNENGREASDTGLGGSSGFVANASSSGVSGDAGSSGASGSSGSSGSSSGTVMVDECPDAGSGLCPVFELPIASSLVAAIEPGLFVLGAGDRFTFNRFDSAPPKVLELASVTSMVSILDAADGAKGSVLASASQNLFRCDPTQCTPLATQFVELSHLTSANETALVFGKQALQFHLYAFEEGSRMTPLDPAPMTANARRAFVAAGPTLLYVLDYASSLQPRGPLLIGAEDTAPPRETIAANEEQVFLASNCPDTALICAIDATLDLDAGTPQVTTIYTAAPNAFTKMRTLYADRRALFWSGDTPAGPATWRCKLGECEETAALVVTGLASSFTRNSSHVYFVANGKVHRVLRTPLSETD